MPQNNQELIINGSTPMERLRNLLNVPPNSRPLDFINPLEKIEQLLTCSICLDRFKHPKLLPCQHSYCMEPCLDGLVEHVKRLVKCPECRAEHPLPFDGVKAFQTNYSLMGFLEIHLQATEENAADLESYIRRYNLERCKVCDEKAEVELCQHCDKKICLECKSTHIDMLKRDLGRLMNQVKRVATRISDSSDTLSRGLDCLKINCDSVKEEIKDYVRRFVKELKKREDSLLNEIDAFQTSETRIVKTTRDNLELESSNITEACNRVESCLKGEREMNEEDLVRFKQIFSEGIDYLRTFNVDVDDISNKKVRFFVGPDPHLLPHAISQFGELQVCTPQFSHKLMSVEQVYVPRFSHIGLESDTYPCKKRQWDPTDANTWSTKQKSSLDESFVPGGVKKSSASSQNPPDDYSARFKRRQMLEEHAWNRLRNEVNSGSASGQKRSATKPNDDSTSTSSVPGTNSNNNNSKNSQSSFESSPWARVSQMTDNTQTPTENTTGIGSNKQISSSNEKLLQNSSINKTDVKNVDSNKNSSTPLVHQSSDPKQQTDPEHQQKKPAVVVDQQKASIQIRLSSRTGETQNGGQKSQIPSEEEEEEEEEEEDDDDNNGSVTPVPIQLFEKMPAPQPPVEPTRPVVPQAKPEHSPLDWKKYLIPNPPPPDYRTKNANIGLSSNDKAKMKDAETKTATTTATASTTTTARKMLDRELKSSSRESVDSEISWNERRNRFVRSKTNPELSTDSHDSSTETQTPVRNRYADSTNDQKEKRRSSYIGYDGSANQDSSTTATQSSYLNNRNERETERKSRYKRKAEKSHSSYLGVIDDEPPSKDRETGTRFDMSTSLTDAPGGKYYQRFSTPKHDYAQKSRTLVKFGSKGGSEGQFNWPRGVAVISPTGEIVVCDSSNHRLQMFDRRGNWLKSMGTYGSAKGEFDCLAGICVNKYRQFVITDRYNHRVQIFDANGRHLREFGSHGQTNGRFNSPWGVVVDQQGFIFVCDKDNHRVQIFQADGSFVGKFGGIGNRDGQFQSPHFIAVNRQNHLIVTDSNNHRVQVFDHNGHFMFSFGSEGFHEGQFKYPRGIAVDEQGFIIVADSGNNRVQIFYPDGRFFCTFGGWGGLDGQMKGVEGVAVGDDGHIVVTDRENHRVQVF